MAGAPLFKSFIERNPKLSFRQAEGLSVARAKGLSREEVNNFYDLLNKVLTENDLLDKPERLYNMDESGIQLNNKPGKGIAKEGAKVVNSVTSAEKCKTMTIVGCCDAIGNFFPPVLIIKGVNKKPEFEEGFPMGSKVYMNKKSAYINAALFYKRLTEHFIPLKPHGKLIRNAWIPVATPANALACFRGSGIYPVDQNALPDTTFLISDTALNSENPGKSRAPHQVDRTSTTQAYSLDRQPDFVNVSESIVSCESVEQRTETSLPQTSASVVCGIELDNQKENISEYGQNRTPPNLMQIQIDRESPNLLIDSKILEGISNFGFGDSTIAEILGSDIESETPSKILIKTSPIPKISLIMSKRTKQSTDIFNSKDNIKQKKDVAKRKKK
ncbi:hypothetical protein EVAR_49210_1 [Eumeta japonica]|uniref:DDE-1 domain-containing protein n=1 Tax=Eumeta variegata TaxID=151549 RepID=A0A4C1XRV5_EUMVA|nr:hypothetical protein EVAR_49210_1 [Eumeta japonica]